MLKSLSNLWNLNKSKKKFFPLETHAYVTIVIIIIIGLIKYLVWFMPNNLSISVDKQNDIDHLASQSPLFIVKTISNFRIRLSS